MLTWSDPNWPGGGETTYNRQFLERCIAYRLQEIEFRKVDAELLDRNKHRIESLIDLSKAKKRGATINWLPGLSSCVCWSRSQSRLSYNSATSHTSEQTDVIS